MSSAGDNRGHLKLSLAMIPKVNHEGWVIYVDQLGQESQHYKCLNRHHDQFRIMFEAKAQSRRRSRKNVFISNFQGHSLQHNNESIYKWPIWRRFNLEFQGHQSKSRCFFFWIVRSDINRVWNNNLIALLHLFQQIY